MTERSKGFKIDHQAFGLRKGHHGAPTNPTFEEIEAEHGVEYEPPQARKVELSEDTLEAGRWDAGEPTVRRVEPGLHAKHHLTGHIVVLRGLRRHHQAKQGSTSTEVSVT